MNIGSKFSVKDDGPMSSSPYACYSCKANEGAYDICFFSGICMIVSDGFFFFVSFVWEKT